MNQSLGQLSQDELLRMIVEEMDGVIASDAEGRYIYVNHHWSMLTGFRLDEVKGKYVHDVVAETQVDTVLRTRKCISGQARLIHSKTGEEIPMYCTYVPLMRDGVLLGCLVHMIQVSENKEISVPSNVQCLLDELNSCLYKMRKVQNSKYTIDNIVGISNRTLGLKELIYKAARSTSTVLIEGETGSGKELVAHSIHSLSPRAMMPFIRVNSSAIPNELLESEFFGYEGGAFTGALKSGKHGKFEMAEGGSMFLDEIDKLPLHLQPKLLRVLQEREIERVGSSQSIPIDVRIIAACNTDLEETVGRGEFRSDLFYRLNVIRIRIPPLRERRQDIPYIADSLLKRLNLSMQLQVPGMSDEVKKRLMEYDWPGNVRELQNVIERAMNYAWCEQLEWIHFKDYFDSPAQEVRGVSAPAADPQGSVLHGGRRAKTPEKEQIRRTLQSCGDNKTLAARTLGISRTLLYQKMKEYGMRTS